MTRGTTPTNIFGVGIDLREANVYITYMQGNRTLFEKRETDGGVLVTETTVQVRLSQEETLLFDPRWKVKMQLRYVFPDGSSDASEIMTARVYDVLKEGPLEYEESDSDDEGDPSDNTDDGGTTPNDPDVNLDPDNTGSDGEDDNDTP